MRSDNPTGADNQQETVRSRLELDPSWVVGFVDGEGCFSVSIHRNHNAKSTGGWQLHPVFHVYQHERYRAVLEELIRFFGCGRVRSKGPNSAVMTFAVDSVRNLYRASFRSSSVTRSSSNRTTSNDSLRSSNRCGAGST